MKHICMHLRADLSLEMYKYGQGSNCFMAQKVNQERRRWEKQKNIASEWNAEYRAVEELLEVYWNDYLPAQKRTSRPCLRRWTSS